MCRLLRSMVCVSENHLPGRPNSCLSVLQEAHKVCIGAYAGHLLAHHAHNGKSCIVIPRTPSPFLLPSPHSVRDIVADRRFSCHGSPAHYPMSPQHQLLGAVRRGCLHKGQVLQRGRLGDFCVSLFDARPLRRSRGEVYGWLHCSDRQWTGLCKSTQLMD